MELGCPLAIRWHGKCPCVERPGAHEVLGHKDSVRFLDFFERLQDRHSTVARIPVAQHATVLPNRYVTSMSILKQSFYRVPIIGKNNTVLWKVGVDTFHNTSCLLWTLPPSVLLFLVSKTPPCPSKVSKRRPVYLWSSQGAHVSASAAHIINWIRYRED